MNTAPALPLGPTVQPRPLRAVVSDALLTALELCEHCEADLADYPDDDGCVRRAAMARDVVETVKRAYAMVLP